MATAKPAISTMVNPGWALIEQYEGWAARMLLGTVQNEKENSNMRTNTLSIAVPQQAMSMTIDAGLQLIEQLQPCTDIGGIDNNDLHALFVAMSTDKVFAERIAKRWRRFTL
jgi:hypothetical protein